MLIQTSLAALGLFSSTFGSEHLPRRRCAYGDECWPDAETWNSFNATIGGRLIRSLPSAAVCHAERYNADKCATAKDSWLDSFWKTNQSGAYAATLWEMGDTGRCFIDTPLDAPCDQGIGTHLFPRK